MTSLSHDDDSRKAGRRRYKGTNLRAIVDAGADVAVEGCAVYVDEFRGRSLGFELRRLLS